MIWSRSRFACFTLLAATLLCTFQLPAQEARWLELNSRATELYQQGKYAECLPVVTEGLKIAEATFGPDDARIGTALYNLARTYDSLGRYGEAEPLYQRALRIQEKALGPDHADVATTLNNLARLYDDMGKYAEVEPLYQRALRIREKALGPDHPEVANTLNGLAMLYDQQSKYAEAEPLFQRALRIDEKLLGPEDPEVATSLINLATLSQDQGKYAEAEALYQRGLHIDEKALGPDHPGLATDLDDLAELYDDIGRSDEAVQLYQRALRIDEKALGPEHPHFAVDLNNLGLLYDRQGNYGKAQPLYERALRINEKVPPDSPAVATDLNNLALLHVEQDEYAQAEPLYQRSVRSGICGVEAPDFSPGRSASALREVFPFQLCALALVAEPLYQRALRIHETALGPPHPDVAIDLSNLAGLYVDQGKYAEAEPLFRRALDNLFQQFQYNFTYMTEQERLGFLHTVFDYFPVYFSFVHLYHEKDPQLTGSMYNLLLWDKSLIVGSVADMRRQVEASGDMEALKLLGQLSAERTQIAALQNAQPPDRGLWRKQMEAPDVQRLRKNSGS